MKNNLERRLYMLKKLSIFISAFLILFVIGACQDTSTTSNETENTTTAITTDVQTSQTEEETTQSFLTQAPTVDDGYLVDNPQDGVILHAWNWSMANVEAHLEEIAIAGYSAVQISPMQPQKDYFGNASWGASWWKLYQPLGFVIATENHSIGTLEDLESLTAAADAYGIKIIVDVVANHLAGGTSTSLNADVQDYEPEIYNQGLIRTGNGLVSDSSIFSVTRGSMGGFPDLQTENDVVQTAVLDLLKAYVDAGVDGFRFDAAKHIETPSDGEYASDFWPTIIDGIRAYASEELYIYGEILNTAGNNRSYTDYLDFMSVTSNALSNGIRTAVVMKDASNLSSFGYINGVLPSQSLLWPESHDDFAAGHTDGISDAFITKTYVIQASRNDATTLYFVRPNEASFMGDVGSYLWQSHEVTEVNRFHNFFVGTDEYISVENGFFLNERYGDNRQGIVIVDVEETGTVNQLSVSQIDDGTYIDQISGNQFIVDNGKITGQMGESGMAVIYNNPYAPKPGFYVSDDGQYTSFTDTMTVTIYSHNTTQAYYRLNGGEQVSFTGQVDVELSHPDADATVTLEIVASNGDYQISRTYTYVKSNAQVDQVTVSNLNTATIGSRTIVAWVWPQGSDGQWVEGTYSDGTFIFDLPEGHDYFLLVLFSSGTTSFNWDNKILQTGDIAVPNDGTYDGSTLTWS